MVLLQNLYHRTLELASHKRAPVFLGILSFTEAIIMPVPPDVMLAPMVLADKRKAWKLAMLTTVTSVAGGIVGYLIGIYLYESLGLWLIELYQMDEHFSTIQQWYNDYGVWMIFIAGFLPIPYKVFTVASGVFSMAVAPFVIASLLGRGVRFYLVAGLCYLSVDSVESLLKKYPRHVAGGLTIILVAGFAYWYFS